MNNTALSWCINLHSAPSPSLQKPIPLPLLVIIIAQFLIIDSTGHFEAERESRMGWRRVELHCGSVWGPCCEGNWVKINISSTVPRLSYSREHSISVLNLQTKNESSVFEGLQEAFAIDFHYSKGLVFWTDAVLNKIRRSSTNSEG